MTSAIGQLPQYYRVPARRSVRRGFLDAASLSLDSVIIDTISFTLVMFQAPKPIAGLFNELVPAVARNSDGSLAGPVWLSFGYLCSSCDKIIMIRDSFTDAASLAGLLDHACTNPDDIFDLGEFRRLLQARRLNREAKFELYKMLTEISAESTDKESL